MDIFLCKDDDSDSNVNISSLLLFDYNNHDNYISNIDSEWNFHCISNIRIHNTKNLIVRLGIASRINNDNDYYLIYIRNDNINNLVIRKLTLTNYNHYNPIIKLFLIDGPLLIIQYQNKSIDIINLINTTNNNTNDDTNANDNNTGQIISLNEWMLVESKSYDNININDNTKTTICLLHLINDGNDNDISNNNDNKVTHKWLSFDVNSFININTNSNNNINDNTIASNHHRIIVKKYQLPLINPPFVNDNNNNDDDNTITGMHYINNNDIIITRSNGYIYNNNNNRHVDNINTNTRYTIIKTVSSSIPNTNNIIIKSNNFDKIVIVSSSLSLMLEVANVGFFVIGHYTSKLCTQLLLGLADDTINDYPIIIKKSVNDSNGNGNGNKPLQWIICEMPGVSGSRHIVLSDHHKSWSKRCTSLITLNNITNSDNNNDNDKKRKKKDNAKKDTLKKQKADTNNNTNTIKMLSDIDKKSQESVIDALNIHLNKIITTTDVMNHTIDQKKTVLQVLRKNLMMIRNAGNCNSNGNGNSFKLNFDSIDNNDMNYLYPNTNTNINTKSANKNVSIKNTTTTNNNADSLSNNILTNQRVIIMDAAYVLNPNDSTMLLFVRVMNKSNMPVFRTRTNSCLISSGKGYMRELNSLNTRSGVVDIIYPHHEAIISSLITLSFNNDDDSDLFKTNKLSNVISNSIIISINLEWTEIRHSNANSNSMSKLNSLFARDPIRLDIEMSHGWLGMANRNGIGGALIIKNNSNNNSNASIMTPFLIVKCCNKDTISNVIKQWYDDSVLKCTTKLSLVSFVCNLSVIMIDDNHMDEIIDNNTIDEKLNHYVRIHFFGNDSSTSMFYKTKFNTNNENIRTLLCLHGYNRNDLYNNFSLLRNCLSPESLLMLFAKNKENIEILRLVTVYLLDEMSTIAVAWRMIIMNKNSKRKNINQNDSNDNEYIRINQRLITNSIALAKYLYLKQQKTDKMLSYAYSRLSPYL